MKMHTCEYCRERVAVPEAYSWLLVTYRPSRDQFLNRVMQPSYNFCSVSCLVAFYTHEQKMKRA